MKILGLDAVEYPERQLEEMLNLQIKERPNNRDVLKANNDPDFVRYAFRQGYFAALRSQEPAPHVDNRWCADLRCKKCYSADTWQKAAAGGATSSADRDERAAPSREGHAASPASAGHPDRRVAQRRVDSYSAQHPRRRSRIDRRAPPAPQAEAGAHAPASPLLPCPFCGGRADIKVGVHTQYVMCFKCEVMGPNLSSAAELIEAWNQRSMPASVTEIGIEQ